MKTVKYQDYLKEIEKAKNTLEEQTCSKKVFEQIWFVNVGTHEEVKMGVNIAGTGNMSAIDAKHFAKCIEIAADIAKEFKYNGHTIQ